jgi:hypothetical protein
MIEFFSPSVRLFKAIVGGLAEGFPVPYSPRPGIFHAAQRDDLLQPGRRVEHSRRLLL